MAWALIAQSAVEGASCNGILAACAEICGHIDEIGGTDQLFIFGYLEPPGLYLWTGTMDQALEGEGGKAEPVAPEHMMPWIEKHGEQA
jgi:hypothetical protein